MHYIVQKNVFREPNYDKIFEALDRLELSYEVVEFRPDGYVDFKTDRKDVFVFGSVRLANIARGEQWFPGSLYGNNHDYNEYVKGYGDNLLNYDSVVQGFGDEITWLPDEFKFIRPCKDSKVFVGQLFTKTKWEDLVENSLTNGVSTTLTSETPIQVATPKKIYKEARTWIINDEVVSSSYYKFDAYSEFSETVEPEGLEFAQRMAKLYRVADAYVMDICFTPDGWRIVEINCINMSGFYQGDLQKIVMALESFYGSAEKAIGEALQKRTDNELIVMIREYDGHYDNMTQLEKLATEIYGPWYAIDDLSVLAVPIGQELARRLEMIVGAETPNPYQLTKELVAELFLEASEDEGNSEAAYNIGISCERGNVDIYFDVDAHRAGKHAGSNVVVFSDGEVKVDLCEYLEGGGVESTFKELLQNQVNKFLKG